MAIFNSFLYVYQRVNHFWNLLNWTNPKWTKRGMTGQTNAATRFLGAAVLFQIQILNDPTQTLLPIRLQYSITHTYCIYIDVYVYVHVYVYVYVYVYVHVYVYIYIEYIYIYVYIYIHIYIYI